MTILLIVLLLVPSVLDPEDAMAPEELPTSVPVAPLPAAALSASPLVMVFVTIRVTVSPSFLTLEMVRLNAMALSPLSSLDAATAVPAAVLAVSVVPLVDPAADAEASPFVTTWKQIGKYF